MENSKSSRIFLGLNALFSLISGGVLLLGANALAAQLFSEPAGWQTPALRVLGVGLLIFGLDLCLMATNQFVTKAQVMLITVMDVGWVLGSIGLLLIYGKVFSGLGQVAIGVVAVFVAVFALGQYLGARAITARLSQASVTSSRGKLLATVSRPVNAPSDVVWRVMNDHPGYADVADNIANVEVVDGKGFGMQRRCYGLKGENWLETCDLFEEGRAFGFRIHTEADDYPYPISDLHGEWTVAPDGNGSVFAISIEAEPKGNLLVKTLFTIAAKRQFRTVLANLADSWAARMEREAKA